MTIEYKGIIDLSNTDYHAERAHLSSSNYKTLLKNPMQFYEEKVLGNKTETATRTQTVYDEGNYAHSLLLEPQSIDHVYRFFDGFTKRGKDWEEFQSTNKDYIILSRPQKVRVENWVKAAKNHKVAMSLLEGGKSELSLFSEFAGIPTKVRADYINVDKGYVLDVKTTAYPTDLETFKFTATGDLKYHLSGALYLDMFERHYGKPFTFYFLVLGKQDSSCNVYSLSAETRETGNIMLHKAAFKYKQCLKSGIWTNSTDQNQKIENNEKELEYEILSI